MKHISNKLLLAILSSVVIPLLGYTFFVRYQMEERLIVDVIRYFLEAKAEDLAEEMNQTLRERMSDTVAWSRDPDALAILEAFGSGDSGRFELQRKVLERRFSEYLEAKQVYELAALLDTSGAVVAYGWSPPGARDSSTPTPPRLGLFDGVNVSYESWFGDALDVPNPDLAMPVRLRDMPPRERLAKSLVRRDRRRSPLLTPEGRRSLTRGPVYVLATPVRDGEDAGFLGALVDLVEARAGELTGMAPALETWYRGPPGREPPPDLLQHLGELRAVAASEGVREGLRVGSAPVLSWAGEPPHAALRPLCRFLVNARGELLAPVLWTPDRRGLERSDLNLDESVGWIGYLRDGDRGRLESERLVGDQVVARDRGILASLYPEINVYLPETKDPEDYVVAFATPVWPGQHASSPQGVILLLMRWSHIQYDILDQVEQDFLELQAEQTFETGYAFLFAPDGDTIIGHRVDRQDPRPERTFRPYYGTTLRATHGLPELYMAVTRNARGALRYEFPRGNSKVAGYCRTLSSARGGFGWIVGVGIDDRDTQQTAAVLGRMLLIGALAVTVISVLWVWLASRALTKPIHRLIEFTDEVARGNLAARVAIRTDDELGQLGRAFNSMGEAILRTRERLIRAEKEAAWREMARQIAHEIKNPLTPMRLSAGLLPRAFREKPEEFPEMLDRSVETILRQIESLRQIASDFGSFAGQHERNPEPVALGTLLDECLELYRGMGENSSIRLERHGEDATVVADREELRRVFINLLDNSFEAIVDARQPHGAIVVNVELRADQVRVCCTDDGPGMPEEVRERLFEPYFSTKTTGTGLGLAISHRIVSDMGGSLRVLEDEGPGTTLELLLPLS